MRFEWIKKILLLTGATLSVSIASYTILHAQPPAPAGGGSDASLPYLRTIATNTTGILTQVSNLQNVIQGIGEFLIAWTEADDSDSTAQIASNLSQLGPLLSNDMTGQIGLLPAMNTKMLKDVTSSNVPYANDLTYSTLLGLPFLSRDPRSRDGTVPANSASNYVMNASGVNLKHVVPQVNWQGPEDEQNRYQNYFNTAMAVESYNAYVIANQAIDKNSFNELQKTLLEQVSDAGWMSTVLSEKIGWVLRQLLLFQSQSFLLMTQLVQSEKQIATSSAMTNALILTLNQQWEQSFVSKAQGVRQT